MIADSSSKMMLLVFMKIFASFNRRGVFEDLFDIEKELGLVQLIICDVLFKVITVLVTTYESKTRLDKRVVLKY